MPHWHISADTGGTFTDCFGIPPGGTLADSILVKVLSSGRLKCSLTEVLDSHTARLAIPQTWNTPDDFFTGFQADFGEGPAEVSAWSGKERLLTFTRPLPALTSSTLDLFTGEEAPMIGARLLTGTQLGQAFPPMEFRLGTTRGTNALLERKGAPVALFITRGFGDLLVIRDQRRRDLFALSHHRPPALFQEVIEIDERLDARGEVIQPLDSGFIEAARTALTTGIRVAAVSLLHSYRNPIHERQVRDTLLDLGFDHVSLSSGLAPLIKLLPLAETAVI
ncbi:MAG: 5-oxoprolinase, partial [Verrucomicrobiae bacterium]|nr:5-oxoprolinase [Verrucomicrobiae bacterium]